MNQNLPLQKQGAEILGDGPVAVNGWMMRGHQHSVRDPNSNTAVCIGGIHRRQQFGRCSLDGLTIKIGAVRGVHTSYSTRRPPNIHAWADRNLVRRVGGSGRGLNTMLDNPTRATTAGAS